MGNKYLVTQTLLNSWLWYLNYEGSNEAKAKQDFENTLNKVPFDNKYMQAGRAFEEVVNDIAITGKMPLCDPADKYYLCAAEIADIVKDGIWQVSGKKEIKIGDMFILLYGRSDVLKGPDIFDIKLVKKYTIRKYFDNTQHKIYFACFPGATRFTYLVSDGKEVFSESYSRDETDSIIPIVSDWWSWINQFPEYFKIYQEKWEAY